MAMMPIPQVAVKVQAEKIDFKTHLCAYCPVRENCQNFDIPEKDCRNCVHVSQLRNDDFACSQWNIILANTEACPEHKQEPNCIVKKII